MKRYRSYTAKKLKLPRRIIFFSAVAVIIVVFTVILGNNLKKKLAEAPIDTSEVLTTTDVSEDKPVHKDEVVVSVEHEKALAGVSAGYLDLTGVSDEEGAAHVVEILQNSGYNCISFLVTDAEGKLTYASPAVEEASRLPSSQDIVSYSILAGAVNSAKARGMRVSCVMTASDSLSDTLVVGELSALGFDEVIVCGFEKHTQMDNDTVDDITSYLGRARAASTENTVFGISFDAEFFKIAQNAPYIEKLYNEAEFFAIDLSAKSATETATLAEELQGSFSAYMLRPLLPGDDLDRKEASDTALTELGISARQYISVPEKIDEETDTADE